MLLAILSDTNIQLFESTSTNKHVDATDFPKNVTNKVANTSNISICVTRSITTLLPLAAA